MTTAYGVRAIAAACVWAAVAFPAFAQSTGGVAPGTMTPPMAGNVSPGKAVNAGAPAIGQASDDPALATANGKPPQQTPKPPQPPDETPQAGSQPNKDYAGSTVSPNGNR